MASDPQIDELRDTGLNPGHDRDDSPPPSDQPDQPDDPSGPGINLDPTGLLEGNNVDLSLPVSLGTSNGESGIGGLIDFGSDGNGLPLLSFDGGTEALINVAADNAEGARAVDVGSLINAALLDTGGTGGTEPLVHFDANYDAYDGNVPLAGDLSSALGATLDHLTTSSSLFDVPALDILSLDGLDT